MRKFLRESVITYKRTRIEQPKKFKSSADVYELAKQLYGDDCEVVESVYIIILNAANNVIAATKVFQGGMTSSVVDNRVIVSHLVANMGCKCALVHNHPSGLITPSQSDKDVTESLKKGLTWLGYQLLDHIIISGCKQRYYSFVDEGIM